MKDILNIFQKGSVLHLVTVNFQNSASHKYVVQTSKTAMSNQRAASGPILVFAVAKVSCKLTTSPYFDNREFVIFGAGGPQCHFITSVTITVRMRTFSVH